MIVTAPAVAGRRRAAERVRRKLIEDRTAGEESKVRGYEENAIKYDNSMFIGTAMRRTEDRQQDEI